MRVYFKTEGGFAHFPGLSRPVAVEVDELPEQEARELRQLVEKARSLDLSEAIRPPAPGAADYRRYEITVEDGGQSHTMRLADPVEDPDLQRLVAILRSKARSSR